jgi:hypothetical protein
MRPLAIEARSSRPQREILTTKLRPHFRNCAQNFEDYKKTN